jgi:hypothetical protein
MGARTRRHVVPSRATTTASAVALLVGAGLVTLAPAAQAAPVAVTLNFSCPLPLIGDQRVSVTYQADVPATTVAGQPVEIAGLRAVLRLPDTATQGFALVGASTIEGTSTQGFGLTGADAAGFETTAPIPRAAVPPSGAFDVPVEPVDSSFAASTPGTVVLSVSALRLTLTPRRADGTETGLGTFDSACTLTAGQDTTLASIAVTEPNLPPTAADDTYTTAAGTTLTVPEPGVLANDTDPEDQPLTAVAPSATEAAGEVELNSDGSFTYTPAAGFSGVDTFTYSASDGTGTSAAATVLITVTPPPVTGPRRADLAAALDAPSTAEPGRPFPVTLTVRNAGPSAATGVSSTIVVPVGLRITDAGTGKITLGHVVSFSRPTLAGGESVTYTVTVTADRPGGPRTFSGATVSTQTRDPRYADNADTASTTVR